ncbi:alcohol dehydrogenase catalytic domain-containing protein [Actinocorallia sp. A-T 12471]|uniref:alcohol dehydrogenase catalytic domain-containing protein n=1 Tax=Actinocorallia sp. A-T 12471 TaxID=3089813 RepID=UPI0029D32F39|nr:alcohol dehydrogenase catalytic domain-containing protein [Actinocorallia sp. A-T 12471]MDX6741489.1 alcohol dehydrogenase catalytic domain-containing protein [Actinocorallia sp. A-T 12471]
MARAAVLHRVGADKVELLDDVTTIDPGPEQVKVRIRATGVCQSDLSTMSGVLPSMPLPSVLGHEGAGIVAAVGAHVTEVAVGDHVVVNWTPSCGRCGECLRGHPHLCIALLIEAYGSPGFLLGDGTPAFGMSGVGTWAEETVVPRQAVVKVPDDVPLEYAAMFGCAVATGVGAAINTAKVRPGAKVAVVGSGGVGLAVIAGAKISGASVILAVDPNPAKHAAALTFGATHTAGPDDVEATAGLLTGGQGFDYVFEAVGKSAAIDTAWKLTARGGDLVIAGAGSADDRWSIDALALLMDAKTIRPAVYGSCDLRRDVPVFVDLWRSGLLDLEPMITSRIAFADLNDAIANLRSGDALRQVVLFDGK